VNRFDIRLALSIVDLKDQVNHLSGHVAILFQVELDRGLALIATAAPLDISDSEFFLGIDHSSLPQDNLSRIFQLQLGRLRLDNGRDIVDYETLLLPFTMFKASGPSLESFETERE